MQLKKNLIKLSSCLDALLVRIGAAILHVTDVFVSHLFLSDSERLLADYGAPFVTAWKITHNYRVWYSNKHPGMTAVTPG